MDPVHLSSTASAALSGSASSGQTVKKSNRAETVSPPPLKVNAEQVKRALSRIIKNTRFQYQIKNGLGDFVVRIIDSNTDKVIREIPSSELQKVQDGIEQALGVLFDEVV